MELFDNFIQCIMLLNMKKYFFVVHSKQLFIYETDFNQSMVFSTALWVDKLDESVELKLFASAEARGASTPQ